MVSNKYPEEYGQHNIAVISSSQSSSFPETPIAHPSTPPVLVFTSHLNNSSIAVHNHSCDCCGTVFACEMQCKPATEQYCEYCEVWAISHGRITNKQKLADHLDDQVVIEEISLRVAQSPAARGLCAGGQIELLRKQRECG